MTERRGGVQEATAMASSMWWGGRKGEERSCQQKAVSSHKCADVLMNTPPILEDPKQGKAEERDGVTGH